MGSDGPDGTPYMLPINDQDYCAHEHDARLHAPRISLFIAKYFYESLTNEQYEGAKVKEAGNYTPEDYPSIHTEQFERGANITLDPDIINELIQKMNLDGGELDEGELDDDTLSSLINIIVEVVNTWVDEADALLLSCSDDPDNEIHDSLREGLVRIIIQRVKPLLDGRGSFSDWPKKEDTRFYRRYLAYIEGLIKGIRGTGEEISNSAISRDYPQHYKLGYDQLVMQNVIRDCPVADQNNIGYSDNLMDSLLPDGTALFNSIQDKVSAFDTEAPQDIPGAQQYRGFGGGRKTRRRKTRGKSRRRKKRTKRTKRKI
jgi:hypothetical protein